MVNVNLGRKFRKNKIKVTGKGNVCVSEMLTAIDQFYLTVAKTNEEDAKKFRSIVLEFIDSMDIMATEKEKAVKDNLEKELMQVVIDTLGEI